MIYPNYCFILKIYYSIQAVERDLKYTNVLLRILQQGPLTKSDRSIMEIARLGPKDMFWFEIRKCKCGNDVRIYRKDLFIQTPPDIFQISIIDPRMVEEYMTTTHVKILCLCIVNGCNSTILVAEVLIELDDYGKKNVRSHERVWGELPDYEKWLNDEKKKTK